MITLLRIRCSKCKFHGSVFFPARAAYVMPDGTKLDAGQALAWCNSCRTMAVVECLPDGDALSQLLALSCFADPDHPALSDMHAVRRYLMRPRLPNLSVLALQVDGWIPARYAIVRGFLDRQREFLSLREAPARCLNCGGHDFGPVSHWQKGDPPIIHPDCGGTLGFNGSEAGTTKAVDLTIEGLVIKA